jgi:hypothetical protein
MPEGSCICDGRNEVGRRHGDRSWREGRYLKSDRRLVYDVLWVLTYHNETVEGNYCGPQPQNVNETQSLQGLRNFELARVG